MYVLIKGPHYNTACGTHPPHHIGYASPSPQHGTSPEILHLDYLARSQGKVRVIPVIESQIRDGTLLPLTP